MPRSQVPATTTLSFEAGRILHQRNPLIHPKIVLTYLYLLSPSRTASNYSAWKRLTFRRHNCGFERQDSKWYLGNCIHTLSANFVKKYLLSLLNVFVHIFYIGISSKVPTSLQVILYCIFKLRLMYYVMFSNYILDK